LACPTAARFAACLCFLALVVSAESSFAASGPAKKKSFALLEVSDIEENLGAVGGKLNLALTSIIGYESQLSYIHSSGQHGQFANLKNAVFKGSYLDELTTVKGEQGWPVHLSPIANMLQANYEEHGFERRKLFHGTTSLGIARKIVSQGFNQAEINLYYVPGIYFAETFKHASGYAGSFDGVVLECEVYGRSLERREGVNSTGKFSYPLDHDQTSTQVCAGSTYVVDNSLVVFPTFVHKLVDPNEGLDEPIAPPKLFRGKRYDPTDDCPVNI